MSPHFGRNAAEARLVQHSFAKHVFNLAIGVEEVSCDIEGDVVGQNLT